jgi:hypothetical protein
MNDKITEYFHHHNSMTAPFYFHENNFLSIHWSDWELGCDAKYNYLNEHYFRKIEYLKQRKLFIRCRANFASEEKEVIEMSLYNYYFIFCGPAIVRKNKFSRCELSLSNLEKDFVSGEKLPPWFNSHDFKYVIYDSLFQNKLFHRSLRLHLCSPMAIYFESNGKQNNETIFLRQIGTRGILVCLNQNLWSSLKKSHYVNLRMDLSIFKKLSNVTLSNFQREVDLLGGQFMKASWIGERFEVDFSKVRYCDNINLYISGAQKHLTSLFIPYDALMSADNDEKLVANFLSSIEEDINESLGWDSLKKMSA